MDPDNERAHLWASTMAGHASSVPGLRVAHQGAEIPLGDFDTYGREAREHIEEQTLAKGATKATGAGHRARQEEPDPLRTCFELSLIHI